MLFRKFKRYKGVINFLSVSYLIMFIISVVILCLYWYNMKSFSISNDPNDWALFGNFLSPIISLFTLGAIIYTLTKTEKNEENKKRIEKLEQMAISTDNSFQDEIFYLHKYKEYLKIEKKINSIEMNLNKPLEEKKITNIELMSKSLIDSKNESNRLVDELNRYEIKILENMKIAEILVVLYFHNELGAEIYSRIFYAMEMLKLKDIISKKSDEEIWSLLSQFRNECLTIIKELNKIYLIQEISIDRMIYLVNNLYEDFNNQFNLTLAPESLINTHTPTS